MLPVMEYVKGVWLVVMSDITLAVELKECLKENGIKGATVLKENAAVRIRNVYGYEFAGGLAVEQKIQMLQIPEI